MLDHSSDAPRKRVKHYDNGEPHFLTFSCQLRLPLLSKDRTRRWFVDALQEARAVHGFHLWAWGIMPEHVHLLLWPPFEEISLHRDTESRDNQTKGRIRGILSSLKLPVGKKAIAWLAEHAPTYLRKLAVNTKSGKGHRFWQAGTGYDENVSEPQALHSIVEYIHFNPVRRGLVRRPEDWMWSSARDWMGLDGSPIKVDRTLPATLEIPWIDQRSGRSR